MLGSISKELEEIKKMDIREDIEIYVKSLNGGTFLSICCG